MDSCFNTFADWAWARHHNEWSWYIRGFIIIAFCGAAWRRHLPALVGLAIFFPVSAVIFPAPQTPKPYVVTFLETERTLLESLSFPEMMLFLVTVIAFLWILAAAFWHRSLFYGLLVANLGGAIKLGFGYWAWGDIGAIALVPTLVTALVFNTAVLAWWMFQRRHH